MNWDQIESRWAAMTRRVRADWPTDTANPAPRTPRRPARPDAPAAIIADRKPGNEVGAGRASPNE